MTVAQPSRRAVLRYSAAVAFAESAAALAAPILDPDAELLAACAVFARARAEVASLESTASDDVFAPAVATMHAAAGRVAELRAHTVGGLRAKAAVCLAALAEDGPAAVAGAFGDKAQRCDKLAWSTLADMAKVTAAQA